MPPAPQRPRDPPLGMDLPGNKRMRLNSEKTCCYPNYRNGEQRTPLSNVVDYSDPYSLSRVLEGIDSGKYGSVTQEYEMLRAERLQLLSAIQRRSFPGSSSGFNLLQSDSTHCRDLPPWQYQVSPNQHINKSVPHVVIDLDVDPRENENGDSHLKSKECKIDASVINLDSDEEDDRQLVIQHPLSSEHKVRPIEGWLQSQLDKYRRGTHILACEGHSTQLVPYQQGMPLSIKYERVVLKNVAEKQPIPYKNVTLSETEKLQILGPPNQSCSIRHSKRKGEDLHNEVNSANEPVIQSCSVQSGESKGEYLHNEVNTAKESGACSPNSSSCMQDQSPNVGSHSKEERQTSENDSLEDLWNDMSLAMECSKDATSSDVLAVAQNDEECIHSYVLEDDLGLVCRICGVIQKHIETIFDYQWKKGTGASRSYISGSRKSKDDDSGDIPYSEPKTFEHNVIAGDISVHPKHMKQMRPHQIEGFNFLIRNLLADKPGGCILAHAPGSGKTFMLISFIQSFLAKYPNSRPLIVLPKGLLATWRNEFRNWQVEDIPLHDFYSTNAINRAQQLDILMKWEDKQSVLFLGYKQFANIICGGVTDKMSIACQDRLLKVPSILILDEGHTPRNENTDVLSSLAKVQTPRKVVLSGTLFQNHVREVFNILNLVRPKFLKMETSRPVVKRIMSRIYISGGRRVNKGFLESAFYDSVEETLQNDDNYKRKVTVIQDLRELTQKVLHYYKGDFMEELPGLFDFTVLLNLSAKQKEMMKNLMGSKFKKKSVGSAVFIHPNLKDLAEHAVEDRGKALNDENIDSLLNSVDVKDGVKAKFFLNILSMSKSAGEKVLVFSHYLLPMKFLERLVVRTKGWHLGKEIFMITGDSSSEEREWSMEKFNKSPDAKIFFGSIKACGEGISLVGASRVIILDVHLNPSVTRQAIGRAFRPGQQKKVYIYRLVAADSLEEEDHHTSFRKELISKLWFEWREYSGYRDFQLDAVDLAYSQDMFLESHIFQDDVKALYRR